MASAGSIFVDLLLRDSQYSQGWNKARRTTRQASYSIQEDTGRIGKAFSGVINPINNIGSAVANISGILAGAFSVQKIVSYSDQWRQLEGRLNIVASSFENVSKTQQDLFDLAQRTRQPLDGILSFYSRLAQFIPEAERAQYDLLGVTESVSSALAITGETAASSVAAMVQFTQAIGTNFEAAGQELRSLQEQAPRLTQALMKALGDGTKSLQQLKEEGKLTRESVLNALSGMGEEGRRLQEELAKVPLTVGQAFARLDNAFLKFIGQSSEVSNVTGLLALSISKVAENLELIAKAALILSGVFVSKLVASFVSVNASALSYQITLGRMAGLNALTTTSVLGLSTALRGLSIAWAAIGGPVGVAVIGALALITNESNYAADSQKRLNEEVNSFSTYASKYASASEELKTKIKQDTQSRINDYQKELVAIKALYDAYNQQGFAGKFIDNLGSSLNRRFGFGGENGIMDIVSKGAAIEQSIAKLRDLQNSFDQSAVVSSSVSKSENIDKSTKSLEKFVVKQKEALETLRQESEYIGLSTLEIEKLRDAREFEAQIAERSYNLKGKELERFKEQTEAIKNLRQEVIQLNYEQSRSAQAGFEEFVKSYQEDAFNSARNVQGVLQNAFKSAEDAFVEFTQTGKLNFKELANSIIQDIIRIQFRQSMASILGAGGGGGGGGLFGSILSGIGGLFGGGAGAGVGTISASQVGIPRMLPGTSNLGAGTGIKFFADGGYLGPGQWGIAGEAGAELIYGGKTGASIFNQDQVNGRGGNVYNIDARGADQAAVERLRADLFAFAGPGVIEERVKNAQTRGSL